MDDMTEPVDHAEADAFAVDVEAGRPHVAATGSSARSFLSVSLLSSGRHRRHSQTAAKGKLEDKHVCARCRQLLISGRWTQGRREKNAGESSISLSLPSSRLGVKVRECRFLFLRPLALATPT